MNFADQIANELLIVDADLSTYSATLERERSEISNTISKGQDAFGNQQPGVAFVNCMYKTLQSIVSADGALCLARQEIKKYIQIVKK